MTKDVSIEIVRALADEVRLGMVRILARSPSPISGCNVVGSCESLGRLSQPAASHHFRKLVEAGVLVETKDGVAKSYRLDRDLLLSIGIDVDKL